MPKTILVTQREVYFEQRKEHADCVDQRWTLMLESLGYNVLLLPNKTSQVENYMGLCDGVLITGGGDINADQHNRDKVERTLLQLAFEKKIPVIAICRGAQLVADTYQWPLVTVSGHVRTRHKLDMNPEYNTKKVWTSLANEDVNSYHNFGLHLSSIPVEFEWIFKYKDNHVEAFESKKNKLVALMWHPEREDPFRSVELDLFKNTFGD